MANLFESTVNEFIFHPYTGTSEQGVRLVLWEEIETVRQGDFPIELQDIANLIDTGHIYEAAEQLDGWTNYLESNNLKGLALLSTFTEENH